MPHPSLRRLLGISLLVAILLSPLGALMQGGTIAAQEPVPDDGDDAVVLEPAVPQRDPFFGIVQAIHDPEMAVAAGATWERLVVWWSAFQPNGPDEWNEGAWPPRRDVEAQRGRGIEPVGVVLHTPPWAARQGGDPAVSPPHNLELPFDDPQNYWGQFMMRLAREYAGAIDTWIVWNEPEFCWTGTVAEFAQLQKVAYLAIKAGNPNATVILTGTTYWMDHEKGWTLYLERLLAELTREGDSGSRVASSEPEGDGGGVAVEGAEQVTGAALGTTPLQATPNADPDTCDRVVSNAQPETCNPSPYFDAIAVHQYGSPLNSYAVPVLYRRILESHGVDAPIWFPESNVVPHDDPLKTLMRGGLRATMEEQANYMIQSAALARAAGVERYAIYKMRDEQPENDQYYGLVRNDGTPRPAYYAYQVAVREMTGAQDAQYFWSGSATPPTADEITALLASTASRAQFVWPGAMNGVRMRRGNDRVTVLWNASAAPLEVGVPSSVPTATLMDKYGAPLPLERGEDGAFRVTLAAATNNTDARDPSLILVGGDPVILVEPGGANVRDPYPRLIDACWGVPGALVWPVSVVSGQTSDDGGAPTGEGQDAAGVAGEQGNAGQQGNAIQQEASPAPGEGVSGHGGSPVPTAEGGDAVGGNGYPAVPTPQGSDAVSGLGYPPAATPEGTGDHGYLPVLASDAGQEVGSNLASVNAWFAPTGYGVSGPWLDFFNASGGVEVLGYPRSPVVADPLSDTQCVQYFQRMVLEWHPENPPEYRIQRRLLGAMLGEAAPPVPPSAADGPDYRHFPFGEQGLGHAVSNLADDATRVGFYEFFVRYGGVDTFGYPMEPPTRRSGPDGVTRWTQRFQAALFEHHTEFDIDGAQPETGVPWRTWRVQLRLLGDEYLRDEGLPFVSGDPAKHVPRPPEPTPVGS